MGLLILVLSSMAPPYADLYAGQRATWDSLAAPGVETRYSILAKRYNLEPAP